MSELNNNLNDKCLNACMYVCMYIEKLFMLKDYSCSFFNNNVQLSKTANKLSISQMSSQHYDHFKYLIMSFKFINTSAIFQIYINRVFAEFINFICVVYLNNIFIYLQSEKEHKYHIYRIFK